MMFPAGTDLAGNLTYDRYDSMRRFLKFLWKLLVSILAIIGAIVVLVILLFWSVFGNYIQTYLSIRQVEGTQFYTMEFHGDYGLDQFLEEGATSHYDLIDFLWEGMGPDLPFEVNMGDYGCSTIAATADNGHALMCRNFDMPDTPAMLVWTNPKNGYRSMSMFSLSFLGFSEENLPDTLEEKLATFVAPYFPLDGVNEKGLAVSVMQVNGGPIVQDTGKPDITTTSAIRMMLDKAATVEEAVSMLAKYDMHSTTDMGYHFMVADARGNSAVVEYVNNEMVVLWNQTVATNFLLAPQDFSSGSGLDRYWTAHEILDETGGVVSHEDAMDLLQACRWEPNGQSASTTQWSCVYDLKTRSLDLVLQEDWDNVLSFRLSRFPFF